MKTKIKVTQRNVNKVLDYLSTYPYSKGKMMFVDEKFYSGLRLSKVKVNQTLNALQELNIIEITPPVYNKPATIYLAAGAFSYRLLNRQSLTRFLIPTIISAIALLKAFDRELLLLAELIVDLLK
ncbi:MAG: hypothetical protein IJA60_02780 [Clostridia bacterium]|nr:hypothetical protein [Clostridia bacterium]